MCNSGFLPSMKSAEKKIFHCKRSMYAAHLFMTFPLPGHDSWFLGNYYRVS